MDGGRVVKRGVDKYGGEVWKRILSYISRRERERVQGNSKPRGILY